MNVLRDLQSQKTRRGDTLVEVALAIGIFSMVAITVAMVVNSSTSSAQTALETTITRQVIDEQAEAIRFVHAAYTAGADATEDKDDRYRKIWKEITKLAEKNSEGVDASNFNPGNCADLYAGDSLREQGAFVLNAHGLYSAGLESSAFVLNDVVVKALDMGAAGNVFRATQTYPRILYKQGGADEDGTLLGQGIGDKVGSVEGIYVIPVQDKKSTVVISGSGTKALKSSYYDFYIRTCWFGPGATRPSSISTTIRLYDPGTMSFD